MNKTSPAKVKVQKITQVAIAVHNLPLVVENYWKILGIGPWNIFAWEYPIVARRTYHGQPAWSREMICHAMVGGVEFELMQPVDGPSLYRDFLEEHGEGLHHLQFWVNNFDEATRILIEEHGFTDLQSGSCGRTAKGCRYHYVHSESLGCIWEVVECEEGINGEPARRYPEGASDSPARLKTKSIDRVAIAVRDIQKTVENYWNILGIGPWAIYEWEEPVVCDRKYRGKPASGRERVAIADVGGVELALCQPLAGDSTYRDYLKEYGEGLHHIDFSVDDVDKAAGILAQDGFPSLQSGRFISPESGNAYNYVDIKPLRAIWGLAHYDEENLGIKPTTYPSQ
jgi:catechol 2,3-dioxygenase-like lactoylglutathione lyase family enzyme